MTTFLLFFGLLALTGSLLFLFVPGLAPGASKERKRLGLDEESENTRQDEPGDLDDREEIGVGVLGVESDHSAFCLLDVRAYAKRTWRLAPKRIHDVDHCAGCGELVSKFDHVGGGAKNRGHDHQ